MITLPCFSSLFPASSSHIITIHPGAQARVPSPPAPATCPPAPWHSYPAHLAPTLHSVHCLLPQAPSALTYRSKSPSTPWLTAPMVPRSGHPSSSSPHRSASLIQVEPGASFTFGPPEPFPLQPGAAWGPTSLLHPHIPRAGGTSDAPSSPMSNELLEPGSVQAVS